VAATSARSASNAGPGLVSGLTCPSCGGSLEVAEGWTNLACRYCETPLLVLGERGIARFMVAEEVDRARASEAVRRWLGRGFRKDPRLRREARVEEAFLAWFPFVRIRFDLVGTLLGTVRRREKRGDRWVTVVEPKELVVERSFDRTAPAGEMAEFGVGRVDLAGDRLLPYDEERLRRRGMVFRPQRAPEEVARAEEERTLERARAAAGLSRVTFSWLAAIRRRVTVVHYPLWVFRYRFRNRTYQVLVDAQDGSLAYGKAPGNALYRAAAVVGAAAGACFVGTTVLQHLGTILRSNNGFAALAGLGAVLAAMVAWGYRQFRHGGVVIEGSGVTPEEAPAEVDTVIRGLVERLG